MSRSRRTAQRNPAPGTPVRIVNVTTADRLELRGALQQGERGPSDLLILWVHTRQQNFAEPEYIGIGSRLVASGVDFLSVDTRGHDFGSWHRTDQGPILFGSAWERFSDCVYDLDAWVDFAVDAGYRRIALIGHGFGGAKVLHYQAQRQRAEIAVLGLASSGAAVRDKLTDESIATARRMVREGNGRDLMPWGTGGDTYDSSVSAEWYVSREFMHSELYGSDNLPPAIARVRAPVIAWYGALEQRENRDVHAMLQWLRENAVQSQGFIGQVVPKLGFFYRGDEAVVANLVLTMLADAGAVQSSERV